MNSSKSKFKKFKIYPISRLSIDQDSQSNISLPNIEGKKALSDILRTYLQEKEKFNLDLKICKENFFDISVPFQKRMDVLINGFKYYNITKQKQETIEFYDYHYHLKNFGFSREHSPLEFKYEITLSADEKTLTKKLTTRQVTRCKISVDMSRMFYANKKNQVISLSSEYIKNMPKYFNINRPGQAKDLKNIGALERENQDEILPKQQQIGTFIQLPTDISYSTLVIAMGDLKVGYIGTSFREKVLVSKYYDENVDKNFLKHFNFEKPVHVLNSLYFLQILFVYQKKDNLSIYNQDVQIEDIYLSDFYYQDLGFYPSCFAFTLPKSNHLQNLLTPKDNLLNKTTPETINLFSKNIFKLPKETLVKSAIGNYIKK